MAILGYISEAKKDFASIFLKECFSNTEGPRKNIKPINGKTEFHAIRGTQIPRFLAVCLIQIEIFLSPRFGLHIGRMEVNLGVY